MEVGDLPETSQRPSPRVSEKLETRHEEIEQTQQQPDTTHTQLDEAEAQQRLQQGRTLGNLRLRPAEDDGPQ